MNMHEYSMNMHDFDEYACNRQQLMKMHEFDEYA